MPKDKDVIKNDAKSKEDKEVDELIDPSDDTKGIPKPLNEALEEVVEKNPKGFLGCGG